MKPIAGRRWARSLRFRLLAATLVALLLALLTGAVLPPARAQGGDAIVVQAREALRAGNGPALAWQLCSAVRSGSFRR